MEDSMKKLFGLILGVVFLFLTHVCLADQHDADVAKAQVLKKAGKWEEAAATHPRNLCKAMYFWNAACQTCSFKDAAGNWQLDPNLTRAQKMQTNALLDKAQASLDDQSQVGTDDEGCSGVNVKQLQRLINKVRGAVKIKATLGTPASK